MGGRVTRLAGSRLLLFNVCASSAMYAAGDLIQQRLEGRKRKKAVDRLATDWKRSGRMGSVGAPIGVLSHYWYTMLDRVLPGITRRAVVRKVMADQCIFGPICLSTFFVGKLYNKLDIIS
jgi:protein Mpv17